MLMILPFIVVYIGLAVLFVFIVRKITKRELFLWLSVVFVVLLPIWDVVLGTIVYFISCPMIPKVAIYETAETDGIYYEGMQDYLSEQKESNPNVGEYKLVATGWIDRGIKKGFKLIEFASDKKSKKYKCTKLDKNNKINPYATAICIEENTIESKYTVKIITHKLGIAEINFKNIYNRTNDKLMAEYKRVSLWSCFPFFEWLDWRWWSKSPGSIHCPLPDDRYYFFEYDVLKPKL